MARINIEDSLFSDSVFIKLCVLMKNQDKALGAWVRCCRLAQSFWKHDKKLIPIEVYEFNKFPPQLEASGLVTRCENGFYFHGSEKNFSWIFSKVENGKK